MKNEPRNVLVTGGWDSIFRILQLILIEKSPVRPIYILDPERWSVSQELKAMAKVKRALLKKFPEAEELLLATTMYDRTDIKFDQELKDAEQGVFEQVQIGGQYVWLAAAVKQFNIDDPELCVEKNFSIAGCFPSVKHFLAQCDDGMMRVPQKYKDTPQYGLYGRFAFPIPHLLKPDMMEIAREHDFLDILELSWFCHRPNFLGQACGMCNPCKDAMTKGMQHRVPPFGRLCFHVKKGLDPRPLLKKFPALFDALKKLKNKATS